MTALTDLSEDDVAAATDDRRFDRGHEYVRYVRGLQVTDQRATGSIQARRVYRVSLDWTGPRLQGHCTCYDHDEGNFCKHLVALGLAVVDLHAPSRRPDPSASALADYLGGLDRAELIGLVRELVDRDDEPRNLVLGRAAAAGRTDALDPDALVAEVNAALSSRGDVDYRWSFEVAQHAQAALDRLADLLDAGAADAVRPALLRATTRIRMLLLHADDSAGVIGDAGQRSLDLYARSCRDGDPDRAALARWLVAFRRDSPGWPDATLPDFAAAFDDAAWRTYRRAVTRWDESLADADHTRRFEVGRALHELADHDGDLDAAVAVLTRDPGHEAYADVVRRLVAAGRRDEALVWLDRAVATNRGISGRTGGPGNDYWLSPGEAADLYLAADRPEDALAVLRREFAAEPGVPAWQGLLRVARALGREDTERRWALAEAESSAGTAWRVGAALVDIHLAEHRLDDAWRAAERHGPGHAWERLAKASARARPADAAELYRPRVEELLRHATTANYRPAAALLVTMRDLYAAAGRPEVFAAYLEDLRARYARRPSLMAELARRRLI